MTWCVCIIVSYPGIGLVGARTAIMQIILVRRPPASDQGAHHLDTSYQSDSEAHIEEPMHPAYWLQHWRVLLGLGGSLSHERRSAYGRRTFLPSDSHNGTRQRL